MIIKISQTLIIIENDNDDCLSVEDIQFWETVAIKLTITEETKEEKKLN